MEGAIRDQRIGGCEYMCIATAETPKSRWKAIGLRLYGSRSYEPGTLSAGLAPKVHQRIGDRELENVVILDSENVEAPKPDKSFSMWKSPRLSVEAERKVRRTCGSGLHSDSRKESKEPLRLRRGDLK